MRGTHVKTALCVNKVQSANKRMHWDGRVRRRHPHPEKDKKVGVRQQVPWDGVGTQSAYKDALGQHECARYSCEGGTGTALCLGNGVETQSDSPILYCGMHALGQHVRQACAA